MAVVDVKPFFSKDFIFFDYECKTRKDLIMGLSKILQGKGYVEDTFADAIWDREERYPTGLPTIGYKIAVPHTDVIHVKRSCIVVAKLKQPVKFREMGDDSKEIDIGMVFMLVVNDKKSFLFVLQRVIQLFSQPDTLEQLKNTASQEELYELVVKAVSEVELS